ncbi:Ig-like domain-containing protein [Micromonospora zhanjiangensis]|uniref:Ig-like domain-containing protein n=1 Tax=Micromonospora zhanjiangensis TaxID=1522057 RepID=A0ABV8KSG7_9ACTN
MWRKLIAMVALLVTLVAADARAPAAQAGGRGQPIFGNFNGDQFLDEAFLGEVPPTFCSVVVRYGTGPGTFGPPVAYIYLNPGNMGGPLVPCPDIGTAVELDPGHPHDELVVAWFAGPPGTIPYNLLVLRGFQPTFGLNARVALPNFMDDADFNGDGRTDIYLVTDQGAGFETMLSFGDGTLSPGPESWCAGPLTYQLRDFNHNRAQDVLISYIQGCADFSNGVVVVLDDGAVRQLQLDPSGEITWSARVVFANSDKFPDVRTVNLVTGRVDYFINTGNGTFVKAPKAVDDFAVITDSRRTAIDVLANDYVTDQATITITTPPTQGTAHVTSSQAVIYTPNPHHANNDRFVYQVNDHGKTSKATVRIRFVS